MDAGDAFAVELNMNKRRFTMEKANGLIDMLRIRRLYMKAFPAYERKHFGVIMDMRRRGKTDVWCFKRDGRFAGFASTINGDGVVLIDYLAVEEKQRGKGTGSALLRALKECYKGSGIFVEIESVYEEAGNLSERMRRKRFYEANGMEELHVLADVFETPMELLGWKCRLDFEGYYAFYRDNYSAWAAEHLKELPFPTKEKIE